MRLSELAPPTIKRLLNEFDQKISALAQIIISVVRLKNNGQIQSATHTVIDSDVDEASRDVGSEGSGRDT